MKALAEKKRPSLRRPVLSWLCSTTSAIMDDIKMLETMPKPAVTVVKQKSSGKIAVDPFSGPKCRSLKTTGIGPIRIEATEAANETRFFPNRLDSLGATKTATATEIKFAESRIEIWLPVRSKN